MHGGFFTPENAHDVVGKTFASNWIRVTQEMINSFGETTGDPDPHHVDPDYCVENSPWKKPISFGFLTLSLLAPMLYDVYKYPLGGSPENDGYPASYGFDRIRLVAPVVVDSRIRSHFRVAEVSERRAGQRLIRVSFTTEIEGNDRPAVVGDWRMLWFLPQAPNL